jgi:putative peptidoglycan lipid II flippase
LWLLSEPVVAVLFERGAFQSESVQLTAALLRGYAFSLLGHSVSAIFIRYWLAAGETLKPAALVLLSSAITIMLQYALVQPFGAAGIGYGAAAGATLQGALLSIPLLKGKARELRLQLLGGVSVLLAAFLLCVVLVVSLQVWSELSAGNGEGKRILFLFVTLSVGFGVYVLPVRKILLRLLTSDVV